STQVRVMAWALYTRVAGEVPMTVSSRFALTIAAQAGIVERSNCTKVRRMGPPARTRSFVSLPLLSLTLAESIQVSCVAVRLTVWAGATVARWTVARPTRRVKTSSAEALDARRHFCIAGCNCPWNEDPVRFISTPGLGARVGPTAKSLRRND